MKKVLLLASVAVLVSACGGGGGGVPPFGSEYSVPPPPVAAGTGDPFVAAVLLVTDMPNADLADVATFNGVTGSGETYAANTETTPDFTIAETLPI